MIIEIVWDGGSGVDEGVESFRRDGNDIVVTYYDGSEERYENADVVGACLDMGTLPDSSTKPEALRDSHE